MLQEKYNKTHKIQPQTIYKSKEDIRLTTAVADENRQTNKDDSIEIDDSTLDGIETKASLEEMKRKILVADKINKS